MAGSAGFDNAPTRGPDHDELGGIGGAGRCNDSLRGVGAVSLSPARRKNITLRWSDDEEYRQQACMSKLYEHMMSIGMSYQTGLGWVSGRI